MTNSTPSSTAAKPASAVTGFSDSFKWANLDLQLSQRLGWRSESGVPLAAERRAPKKPAKAQIANRPVPGRGNITNATESVRGDRAYEQNRCAAVGDCSISCHYDLIEHVITLTTTLLMTFLGRACVKFLCQRTTTNDLEDLEFPM